MQFKKLILGEDLRESISYGSHAIPLSVCVDNFDDYFHREWECHWHDEIEFGIIEKGAVQFMIYNGQAKFSKELHQGDGIFINSGYLHSAKALVTDTIIAELVLPITFFDKPFENAAHQILSPVLESDVTDLTLSAGAVEDLALLSAIQEICSITDQGIGYELHFVELVCKIWRLLTVQLLRGEKDGVVWVNGNRAQEQRVKQILSYIHTHYSEHINVDDMARFAMISRTECFRCFQTFLGKSPIEYLTEYRLSMATMLLANSERTLSDITYLCGFSSPSYFGKLFREQCGYSPKKYREQVRTGSRNDEHSK